MARLDGRVARQTEQSEGEAECSENMTGEVVYSGQRKFVHLVGLKQREMVT